METGQPTLVIANIQYVTWAVCSAQLLQLIRGPVTGLAV